MADKNNKAAAKKVEKKVAKKTTKKAVWVSMIASLVETFVLIITSLSDKVSLIPGKWHCNLRQRPTRSTLIYTALLHRQKPRPYYNQQPRAAHRNLPDNYCYIPLLSQMAQKEHRRKETAIYRTVRHTQESRPEKQLSNGRSCATRI